MLYAMPALDDADLRVLGELNEMRSELSAHLRSKPHWEGQLRRSLFAAAIQGSNTIENITISSSDARALVEHAPMSAEAGEATQQAVIGYRDAMTYVLQTPLMEFFDYSETLLSALHFMITKYQPAKWPGRYRSGEIFVTSADPLEPTYTGPDADLVPRLMGELVEWLRAGDAGAPAYARAAMAHLNLVGIHPWRDGNGRTSRCLHTLVLAQDRVLAPEFSSIEEWLGDPHNTFRYYDALATLGPVWDPHRADARPWIRFCLRAHHLQAQTVQRRVDRARMLWGALEAVVIEHGLDERMVSGLYAAAVGELRRATYAKDEGLTRDQSVRDMQQLRRHGLIQSVGHARTQRYVADGEIAEINMAIVDQLRAEPLREPYGS